MEDVYIYRVLAIVCIVGGLWFARVVRVTTDKDEEELRRRIAARKRRTRPARRRGDEIGPRNRP